MAFDHLNVNEGTGQGVSFVDMGDGTKAQAVVPVIGTDQQSDANPAPVKVISAPLPTGAATELKQDAGNLSLVAIGAKVATAADIASTEAVLHHILRALQILATRIPLPNAAQQLPVAVNGTVGITSNSAVNVGQVAGQNTATGLGASGNGAARVTPANDTVAGVAQVWAFQQSFDVRNFRNRIVT